MKLFLHEFDSPVGVVLLATDGQAVRALDFADYRDRMTTLLARHYGEFELTAGPDTLGAVEKLQAYFAGELLAGQDLPLATNGTAFQQKVWTALRTIDPGQTASYGDIAKHIGQPTASRAIGLANGANPIAILVPCHRVIGANAKLTGYGGGLERKAWLLGHEGVKL
ncbi:MAG: methylated-DNA--[protein]-cysteine S-methyltransferase [Fimbriiglobus sp.]